MPTARIEREIAQLHAGGQDAEIFDAGRLFVVYRRVVTSGERFGLPGHTDVIVPVPEGYPAPAIDLAGLPVGSPFLPRVKGGANSQGVVTVEKIDWQLASYHPHGNGGGPTWDPTRHGFHTYFDHLLTWLDRLV